MLSTAYLVTPRYSSVRKIVPLCGTMGRINTKQMGPLYRTKLFQDTIQFDHRLFLQLLREEITELLQKRAVEMIQDTGTPGFLFPAIPCPEKERKVTSCNRSFSVESLHKETTVQNDDSQVSTTIDTSQWLGCLHRSDRCLSTLSDSSSIQEVPSFHVRKSGLHCLTFRNVP